MKNEKMITIYASSEMFGNMVKYEGKLFDYGTKKWAQYDNAPFVQFVPKGKRKLVQIQKSYKPNMLILSGIGHPEPEDAFVPVSDNGEVAVSRSRYSSFDEGWAKDFDQMIDQYIAGGNVEVIADYRSSKGFNSN